MLEQTLVALFGEGQEGIDRARSSNLEGMVVGVIDGGAPDGASLGYTANPTTQELFRG